ncbi:MAG: hypothetical protein QNK23_14745 [Crocinitomicaceae bacterium]|nr:hypothetical protein [Crocinitomicaceae bacterium]
MSWTDENIDKLYQDRTNDLSFDYKPEYWDAFNASLPAFVPDVNAVDEVDNMYQQEASEVEIPYKEKYWAEMETMLPNRRRADILWFATSFVFIGLLFISLFMNQDIDGRNDQLISDASLDQVSMSDNVVSSEQISTTVVDNSTLIDSNANGGNTNSGSTNNEVIPSGFDSNTNQIGTTTNLNNPSVPTSVVTEIRPSGSQVADITALITVLPEPELDPIEELPVRITNDVANVDITNISEPSNEENRNNSGTEDATNTIDLGEGPVGVLATQELPMNELAPDTSTMRVPQMDLPIASAMYIEVNGGISQSLITPSDNISSFVGFGFGAQFYKGRFAFTTGINGVVSFHDDLVLNRQAKVYGFGSQVYNYTIKFNQLYTLEANLSIGYRFGRHQLNVGIRPSFIVGTKVGFTQNSGGEDLERLETYGYTDGIHKFGLKPMIGYAFDISPDWTVGINIGAQVMNTVNDDYINGSNSTLPFDGQLYIRKSISFKKSNR